MSTLMPAAEIDLRSAEITLLALLVVIIFVGIAARLVRLPYTTALVLAGLGLGAFHFLPTIELTPDLVLLLFLPPLAFEAAFHLDLHRLRADLVPVSAFALIGVFITMTVVGALLAWGLGWGWSLALLFGTLVAATDPVSVVAAFRELGVVKRLSILMEGESLFNDGTGIVLFRLALTAVVLGRFDPSAGIVEFLRLVLGGIAIGAIAGFLVARLLAWIDDYLIEISVTVVTAWGTYLLAENDWVHASGVIAVVVAGLVLGNYGARVSFSPTTKIVLAHVLEFVAFVANSFIFLLIGLQVRLDVLATSLVPIAWAIGATLAARAVAIYGLAAPLALISQPIPWRWRHVLWWGGLRGGLTLALALSLPDAIPLRGTLIAAAYGVVLFTLVVEGLTIRPLLVRLGLVLAESGREHELTRGRLLAMRAAQKHVEQLRDRGSISDEAYEALASQYATQEDQLQVSLRTSYGEHSDLTEAELAKARLEGLRAERSALSDLRHSGALSDADYRELASDIDLQLSELAEHRAVLGG